MAKLPFANDWQLYLKTGIFGAVIFAICYFYIRWLNIPGELNKAVADTAILLMGFSMLISSISYFWDFLDWTVVYRKYLGLIGFAFGVAHLILSWGAFTRLFEIANWQAGTIWAAFSGTLALVIFTIMALISNTTSIRLLGGKTWRYILRTGYIAVLLVVAHVVLLRWGRWVSWYQEGMPTLPSPSLLVTIFMVIVVGMRIVLWWRLRRAKMVL